MISNRTDVISKIPYASALLEFCLISGLSLSLLVGRNPVFSAAGWALIAAAGFIRLQFALCAIFFFSAFFNPSGFFTNPAITVKHFHIALLISALILLQKGDLTKVAKGALKKYAGWIAPLVLLLGIAVTKSYFRGGAAKEYFFTGNILLMVLSSIYIAELSNYSAQKPADSLRFLVYGVALQVVTGIYNFLFNHRFLDLQLMHDNHFGILCSMTCFFSLALLFSSENQRERMWNSLLTGLVFLGMILTLCRSAWMGFLLASCIFFAVRRKICQHRSLKYGVPFTALFIYFTFFAAGGAFFLPDVRERFMGFARIFKPSAWIYSFHDKQNFGFFGISRLNQLREARDILGSHLLTGIGFTHEVTDFHCLYLTLLAASGIIGLFFFLFFITKLVFSTLENAQNTKSPGFIYFLACACALCVWLVSSCVETLLIQFFIWTTIAFSLSGLCSVIKSEKFPSPEQGIEKNLEMAEIETSRDPGEESVLNAELSTPAKEDL